MLVATPQISPVRTTKELLIHVDTMPGWTWLSILQEARVNLLAWANGAVHLLWIMDTCGSESVNEQYLRRLDSSLNSIPGMK